MQIVPSHQFWNANIPCLVCLREQFSFEMFSPWFQISTDSDTHQQYHIGFWDTRYYIDPIILDDMRADIANSVEIADIDEQV